MNTSYHGSDVLVPRLQANARSLYVSRKSCCNQRGVCRCLSTSALVTSCVKQAGLDAFTNEQAFRYSDLLVALHLVVVRPNFPLDYYPISLISCIQYSVTSIFRRRHASSSQTNSYLVLVSSSGHDATSHNSHLPFSFPLQCMAYHHLQTSPIPK